MKREGRQHGMVRSYQILPPPWNLKSGSGSSRLVNQLDSPPTAGLFTKVTQKPTNHSKFTGKCGRVKCIGCHDHPACKSKDKAKGTHKLRSNDVVANHRLVSWGVVDAKPGSMAAANYLDHLADEDGHYVDYGADMVKEDGLTGEGVNGFGVDQADVDEEDAGWYLVTEM